MEPHSTWPPPIKVIETTPVKRSAYAVDGLTAADLRRLRSDILEAAEASGPDGLDIAGRRLYAALWPHPRPPLQD